MTKIKDFAKRHKKLLVVILAVVVAIVFFLTRINKKAKQLPAVQSHTLEVSDLKNWININGLVESKNSVKVYTSLALPVEENLVEIGDTVKEGDLLCRLDTKSIENSIQQSKSAAGSQQAANNQALKLAQKQYENAINDKKDDSSLSMVQAEQALEQARMALYQARYNLRIQKEDLEDQGFDKEDIRKQLSRLIDLKDNAEIAYDAAYKNYKLAQKGVGREIEAYSDAIETQQITASAINSQWIAISHLEEQVDDASIASPISGVVTGIFVAEGAPTTGLMYVIEDIDNLQIVTALKDYDLSLVKEGNPTEIRSDATGDEIFQGSVERIAPTATKSATGDVAPSGTTGFETIIDVSQNPSPLKVGSQARVEIIYQLKENVISVPYEAVTFNPAGEQVVFLIEEESLGLYKLKEVPVTLGMESDFTVEIISDQLSSGDKIVSQAVGLTDGMIVNMAEDLLANQEGGGGFAVTASPAMAVRLGE